MCESIRVSVCEYACVCEYVSTTQRRRTRCVTRPLCPGRGGTERFECSVVVVAIISHADLMGSGAWGSSVG